MASPAHKRRASDIDTGSVLASQHTDVASSSASNTSVGGGGVTVSSPFNVQGGPSASTPHSFNLDTFDFGADFSLPSSLDELSIFNSGGGNGANGAILHDGQSTHSNFAGANGGNHSSRLSQAGSHPSPGNSTTFTHPITSTAASARLKGNSAAAGGGVHSSSNSVAGSPRSMNFSPRTTMREQILHASKSRHQSPHGLSMGSNESVAAGALASSQQSGSEGNGLTLNATELQNLLHAINASTVSQQQHQQQIQGGNLSIGELEKLLSEKEQMERMQSVQTAFLRQQLESLQKQNPGGQVSLGQSGHDGSSSGTSSSMSAAQLMQQFNQLNSQQMLNGGMPGNGFPSPFPFDGPAGIQPPHMSDQQQSHNFGGLQQPKQSMSTSMSQYGLITPVSGDAFPQKHHPPFVSPLSMPGSSQAHMMDTSRAALALNGSLTPLESPAITPASVFSNIGSSSNSTDLFSPLTSPALHPQQHGPEAMALQMSPFLGPIKGRPKGRGVPGASPNGPTATKSVPRKNRSTTAEARANRARASPLVKPTLPSSSTGTHHPRKRDSSLSGNSGNLASPLGGPNQPSTTNAADSKPGSRRTSQSEGDGRQTPTAFPPLLAGSGSAKPMDASPSEAANSTPSPIEMPPPNGKPLTPSSLMGIRGNGADTDSGNGNSVSGKGNGSSGGSLRSTSSSGKQVNRINEKQVSFATQSPASTLQSILPGGVSNQDREAWIASMKTATGTGGNGGGLESRRTSHKAAEQKRRDSLKFCFDELRNMLPAITLDDDVPGGSMLGPDGLLEDQNDEDFAIEEVGDAESARIANRAISKVALLRHSNEYLIRLKHRIGRRERDLATCRREIMDLRSRLGVPIPPEWPAMTASMAASALVMGYNTGIVNMDALADQMHPHQAAILAAAMQQQQQQHLQHQSGDHPPPSQHPQMDLGPLTGYSQAMHHMSGLSSMDTSS